MDIKSFLIGLLCSVLVVILFVAWSDVGAAPAAATENRYQLCVIPSCSTYLLDQKTGTVWAAKYGKKATDSTWRKLIDGPPQ